MEKENETNESEKRIHWFIVAGIVLLLIMVHPLVAFLLTNPFTLFAYVLLGCLLLFVYGNLNSTEKVVSFIAFPWAIGIVVLQHTVKRIFKGQKASVLNFLGWTLAALILLASVMGS